MAPLSALSVPPPHPTPLVESLFWETFPLSPLPHVQNKLALFLKSKEKQEVFLLGIIPDQDLVTPCQD